MLPPPPWMLPRDAITGAVVRRLVVDGSEEGQRLEFKGRGYTKSQKDELRKDVVGLLNGGGGLLILGIEEESHRAARIVPVPDAEDHCRWIEQVINSGVEPYPMGLEVFSVDVSGPRKAGDRVVAIRCVPGLRPPYARTSNGKCRFFQRKGTEVLSMTLDDIRAAFRSGERALADRETEWGRFVDQVARRGSGPALIARLSPAAVGREVFDPLDPVLRRMAATPGAGQPRGRGNLHPLTDRGFDRHVLVPYLDGLKIRPVPEGQAAPFALLLGRSGDLSLVARGVGWFGDGAPEGALDPAAVCAYPAGLTALAATLYAHAGVPGPFVVSLALTGVEQAVLTDALPTHGDPAWRAHEEGDLVAPPTLQIASFREPEHPFFRSIQRLFQAFGFEGPPAEMYREDGTLHPEVCGESHLRLLRGA